MRLLPPLILLVLGMLAVGSSSARAVCIEPDEIPWFWPADGAIDVPTNSKIFAHSSVQEAFLDGEPVPKLSNGVFDPGALAAGSSHVLRLVTRVAEAEAAFTVGEAPATPPPADAADIEEVFVVAPEVAFEDVPDHPCFVDAVGTCLDTCDIIFIRARVSEPHAFAWWIEAHGEAGFAPSGCGEHLYIPVCRPSHLSPQACVRLDTLNEGADRAPGPEVCASVPRCLYENSSGAACSEGVENEPTASSGGCALSPVSQCTTPCLLVVALSLRSAPRRRRHASRRAKQ